MANIFKHGPGYYTIYQIECMASSHAVKSVQVEAPSDDNGDIKGHIWLMFDGSNSVGAYAWVKLDDAEAIGLAILEAVQMERERVDDS